VAVDPNSVPYGTALWLQTEGVALSGARMVVAQDTGGAIVGAVRADFFTGWGQAAKDTAYQLKQRMRWWALLPRTVPLDQPTSTKGTGDG
jgi:membrane-bound lytic murein transglycosylase A